MITFSCQSCNQEYSVPDNAAGKKTMCKKCNSKIVVPYDKPEVAEEVKEELVLAESIEEEFAYEPVLKIRIKSKNTAKWIWRGVMVWWCLPVVWFFVTLVLTALRPFQKSPRKVFPILTEWGATNIWPTNVMG